MASSMRLLLLTSQLVPWAGCCCAADMTGATLLLRNLSGQQEERISLESRGNIWPQMSSHSQPSSPVSSDLRVIELSALGDKTGQTDISTVHLSSTPNASVSTSESRL